MPRKATYGNRPLMLRPSSSTWAAGQRARGLLETGGDCQLKSYIVHTCCRQYSATAAFRSASAASFTTATVPVPSQTYPDIVHSLSVLFLRPARSEMHIQLRAIAANSVSSSSPARSAWERHREPSSKAAQLLSCYRFTSAPLPIVVECASIPRNVCRSCTSSWGSDRAC